MKYMFPRYKDIKDWDVLETRIIHAYNDDETPIEVVKLQIGILERYEITGGLGTHITNNTFPIIRWISKQEYDYLREGEGAIIW